MTTVAEAEAGLEQANAAVEAARSLINGGSQIDLGGLESYVERLCADIASLPDDGGGGLITSLVKLIDGLNGLADMLLKRHESLSGELKDMSARQRAVSAYGAGTEPDKPKDT